MVRHFGLAALAACILALGGCMGDRMTYGTGTSPGKQTVDDLSGIVALGGKTKPSVRYQPRPKLVAPPTSAALPAPGSSGDLANANWPKDPDEAARQRALDKAKQGTSLIAADNPDVEVSGIPSSGKPDIRALKVKPQDQALLDRDNAQKADKIRAEIKMGEMGVDANGNRIRKTLTEPPTAYREPDPGAPTEFKTVKKKFRWPWQKNDPYSVPDKLEEGGQ